MRAAKWVTRGTALGLAVALAAGCSSDSGGGGGNITPQEKTALAAALSSAQALQGLGPAAAYSSFIFTQLDQVGTLGAAAQAAVNRAIEASISGVRASSYDGAIGMQVSYTINSQGQTYTGAFTGVLGWTNLTTSPPRIDEAVSAGAVNLVSSTPFSSGTIQLDQGTTDPFGLGSYYNRLNNSAYLSTSGTFTVSGVSFAGEGSDCSASAQGVTLDCTYTLGTMSGSFAFEAALRSGSGPATYSQSSISFSNLPSARMDLTITAN